MVTVEKSNWETNGRVAGTHRRLDERWYGLAWPHHDGSGWSWEITDMRRPPRGLGDGIEVGSARDQGAAQADAEAKWRQVAAAQPGLAT